MDQYTPITYIYGLVDPRDERIRYIGKANNPARRRVYHLTPRNLSYRTPKNSWLKHLLGLGLEPSLLILQCVPVLLWEEAERSWIARLRPQLVNATDGGDGAPNLPPESLERMAAAGRGRVPWNKGKKQTPEQCANNARSMLGRPGYWVGKRLSADHRAKLSAAKKGCIGPRTGIPQSEDTRNRLLLDWIVNSPTGEIFTVRNLAQFCRDRDLRPPLMNKVAHGLRPHHKGWTCRKA